MTKAEKAERKRLKRARKRAGRFQGEKSAPVVSMRERLVARSRVEVVLDDGSRWMVRPVDGRALTPHGGAAAMVALQGAAYALAEVAAENNGTTVEASRPSKKAVTAMMKSKPELVFDLVNMCDAYVCAGAFEGASPGGEFEPLAFCTHASGASPEAGIFHVATLPTELRIELGAAIKEASSAGLDIRSFRKGAGSADADAPDGPDLQGAAA